MRIFLSLILMLFLVSTAVAQEQEAEVTAPKTYLRKTPNSAGEIIRTVEKGERLSIVRAGATNGWYFVADFDGKSKGWISENTIRTITVITVISPSPGIAKTPSPTPIPIAAPRPTPIPTASPVPNPTPSLSTSPDPNTIPNPSPSPKTPVAVETKRTPAAAAPSPTPEATPTPAEDSEVLRVDTEEVSLNIRVFDSANRSVSNLDQSKFQIYEDDVLQPITSLATTEVPLVNSIVIDNSRSLRLQLGKIIEAGKVFIRANRDTDQSAIIRFVSADKIEVVQDFTSSKAALNNSLDNLFVEGGQTAIIDAVYRAAVKVEQYQSSQKKEDVKLRSLILVSDGDDRSSMRTETELFKLLRESHVQIYAIGFVNDLSNAPVVGAPTRREKAKALLTRLAEETGGKVYFPAAIDELPGIASEVSGELRTQYVLSYSPTGESERGAFRKIKVIVADGDNQEKRTAVTRPGRTTGSKPE